MATSKTQDLRRLMGEYNSQRIKFMEEGEIKFSDNNAWIDFIAIYFVYVYKSHLEYWQASSVDDRQEYKQWQRKIDTELEPIYGAFKNSIQEQYRINCDRKKKSLLAKLGIRKCRILLDTTKNAKIYKDALKSIGSNLSPENVFFSNVRYMLDFDKSTSIYKVHMKYL